MGSPFSPTSHHSEQILDPPWFLKPRLPDMPAVTAVNQQGQTIELPYMRYALMDEEPMLLGTDKKGGDVYGEYLQATPMRDMQLHARVDDLALDELYTDYPFNWTQQLALFHLGDAGILADVHRYRQSYLKLKLLKNENERLSRILLYVQGEHEQHNKEIEGLLEQVKMVKQRLVDARVLSRIAPVMQRMAIEGKIPDPFYPQMVERVTTQPINTPVPTLQVTNPDPPSPPELIRPTSPTPPDMYTPTIEVLPVPAPQVRDYTAGNPRGPHHQPTPFEDDRHCPAPRLTTKPLPGRGESAKTIRHRCFYCGQVGHWNNQCASPHTRCNEVGKCVVPLRHRAFNQACEHGGRTPANHPMNQKRKRELEADDTMTDAAGTPNNTPIDNALPPADSLLFAPLDPLAKSFQPSRYQTAPPPGTWGNAPWGAGWDEYAARHPSPCIFEYGRTDSFPLHIGGTRTGVSPEYTDPANKENHTDEDSTTTVATDLLPDDFGVENLTLYDEQDLPGAVYYPDDDPFAPTTAKVVQYRQKLLRDLGVSG